MTRDERARRGRGGPSGHVAVAGRRGLASLHGDGGNRTPTAFRPAVFETAVSTVPPHPRRAIVAPVRRGAAPRQAGVRANPSARATSMTRSRTAGATARLNTLGMM